MIAGAACSFSSDSDCLWTTADGAPSNICKVLDTNQQISLYLLNHYQTFQMFNSTGWSRDMLLSVEQPVTVNRVSLTIADYRWFPQHAEYTVKWWWMMNDADDDGLAVEASLLWHFSLSDFSQQHSFPSPMFVNQLFKNASQQCPFQCDLIVCCVVCSPGCIQWYQETPVSLLKTRLWWEVISFPKRWDTHVWSIQLFSDVVLVSIHF